MVVYHECVNLNSMSHRNNVLVHRYYEDHERSTLQIQLLHPQLKVYAYDILFPATSLATPSNGPRETMNQNKLDEHVYDVGNASHLGAASDDVPAHR